MPLKRTYSTSTTVVPAAYQQTKKRRIPLAKRRKYPMQGTVGRPMPFPTRMVGTLRYCETTTMQSALVPVSNLFFSCNSIYDPNRSGTGHQPYGHDTYATIYDQYTVLSSKITVKCAQTTGVLFALTWGVGIEDDNATAGGYDTWMERPTYVSRRMITNAGAEDKSLSLTWNRNKRFPQYDTYQSLSAPFGASPAEEEFFTLYAQSATSGTAIGTINWTVMIEYTCEFYELKDLGSS